MGRLEVRKRNKNNRQRKSIVAIGCEGKNKTEKVYLKNYSSRECRNGKRFSKIYKKRRFKC